MVYIDLASSGDSSCVQNVINEKKEKNSNSWITTMPKEVESLQ
jgi:hypothetical protein